MTNRARTHVRQWLTQSRLAAGLSAAGLSAAGMLAVSCGSSSGPATSGTFGTTGTARGGLSGATGSSSGTVLVGLSGGFSGGGLGGSGTTGSSLGGDDGGADAATCGAVSRKGMVFPVDIFIMMDQSGSMLDKVAGPNGTMGVKWDFLKQAFTTFVNDPQSSGIGVGIQYFPIPNIDNSSCDAGTYAVTNDPAQPKSGQGVGIAALPGNAMAIVTSLNAHTPGGKTPTVPALTGALQYAKTWATQNPTHKVVVVFATDGAPHGCDASNDIPTAAGVAMTYASGSPAIPTYVIGIGDSLMALDQIAQGGGTAPALIVNTGVDTAGQFLAAMNKIRSSALIPCSLTIPSGNDAGSVDFTKVNVVDNLSDGGAPVNLFQVPNAAMCGTQLAWYYDSPTAPKSINLCPSTCNLVTQDMTDQVDILLGCQTLTVPPPR